VARSLGVDLAVVRLVAVVLAFVSGGSVLVAYLLAWVLIPEEPAGSALPAGHASAVATVDTALTRVGERLRDPAVQESARRAAARLVATVDAGAAAVRNGSRRGAGSADAGAQPIGGSEPEDTGPSHHP
jgi:hypothetical protein